MSRFIGIAVVMLVLLGASRAEEPAAAPSGIVIGSSSAGARPARGQCVEVQIGIDTATFHCLNQALKQQVDRAQAQVITPPLTAQSQDIHVGLVNSSAVRQQYGKNFGVSVIPPGALPPFARH